MRADVLAEGTLNELMASVDRPAMAVGVGRAVADNAARTRAEGTDG
ncbi:MULTISPECIES: hypothetical protein [unclassified Streptomyces]|nr:hypothetical protein [Streptomyces sp. NBC_01237]WRZ77142.1 hypothetical protein OG251_01095 [Streptomyces sp. NBC_01237]